MVYWDLQKPLEQHEKYFQFGIFTRSLRASFAGIAHRNALMTKPRENFQGKSSTNHSRALHDDFNFFVSLFWGTFQDTVCMACLTSNLCCKTKKHLSWDHDSRLQCVTENKSAANFAYSTVVQAIKHSNKIKFDWLLREFQVVVLVNDDFRGSQAGVSLFFSVVGWSGFVKVIWAHLQKEWKTKTLFNI